MNPLVPAAFSVAIAQVVKGVTGFGGALVAVPLLSMIWGPAEAIFVTAATDFIGGTVLLAQERRLVAWKLIAACVPGVLVGQLIGTELLVRLDPTVVTWCLATVVGLWSLSLVIRPVRPGSGELSALPSPAGAVLGQGFAACFAGGLMGGLVGASGPPIVAFMKHHFEKDFFRAQLIAIFLFGASALCTILWVRGAADVDTLLKVPWLLIPILVGNQFGAWMAPKVPAALFGRIVGLLLLATSVVMVLK